ncbi:MAG: hypothetical protein J2P37_01935 [Ktedonobacteraceae bacterium]|nr:hypothetical protein [Ktedonobacteraceae bacterium]MBO0794910.1 hypothetical protein [Ktedonobacteraceae bacterium]
MTTGQDVPESPRCPRCGGLMYRPAGSPFYWHATSDHPPCNITNIAEIPGTARIEEARPQPPVKSDA